MIRIEDCTGLGGSTQRLHHKDTMDKNDSQGFDHPTTLNMVSLWWGRTRIDRLE